MIHDLAAALTYFGSPARVEDDTIIVGGERITATLTGNIVAKNDNHRVVLGTIGDHPSGLAYKFVSNFR